MAGRYIVLLACIIAHIQGAAIDISTCGSTKGCFGFPVGCITDAAIACSAVATWKPNGNKIRFELSAKTGGPNAYYVAFGILEPSATRGMSKAIVMDCIGTTGNPTVAYSMNDATTNTPVSGTPGITVASTEFANGEVRCVFDRDTTVSSNAANFMDLGTGNSYKVNIAHGTVSAGAKGYHFANKAFTANPVDFTATVVSKGVASRSLTFVKVHGALMIISWILMVGTAVTLARYYKDMWPGTNVPVIDKPIWFSFHSICNVIALLCTILAFILIFYFNQEWSDLSGENPSILRSHPILGVIVTACAIINPLMALCRPHPGAKRRPIFNWFHWLVGTVALVAGILTVFSGLNLTLSKSFTKPWMTRLLLAFVIFAFVVDIVLEVMLCMVRKRKATSEMEMTAPGEPQGKPSRPTPPASALRNALFFLYFVFALGTTVAIVVGIFL